MSSRLRPPMPPPSAAPRENALSNAERLGRLSEDLHRVTTNLSHSADSLRGRAMRKAPADTLGRARRSPSSAVPRPADFKSLQGALTEVETVAEIARSFSNTGAPAHSNLGALGDQKISHDIQGLCKGIGNLVASTRDVLERTTGPETAVAPLEALQINHTGPSFSAMRHKQICDMCDDIEKIRRGLMQLRHETLMIAGAEASALPTQPGSPGFPRLSDELDRERQRIKAKAIPRAHTMLELPTASLHPPDDLGRPTPHPSVHETPPNPKRVTLDASELVSIQQAPRDRQKRSARRLPKFMRPLHQLRATSHGGDKNLSFATNRHTHAHNYQLYVSRSRLFPFWTSYIVSSFDDPGLGPCLHLVRENDVRRMGSIQSVKDPIVVQLKFAKRKSATSTRVRGISCRTFTLMEGRQVFSFAGNHAVVDSWAKQIDTDILRTLKRSHLTA